MVFGRRKPYDRRKLLDEAAKARAKGRHRKAIERYRRVLEEDGADPDVEGKLAMSLAETGRLHEAWPRYRSAVQEYARRGFTRKSAALLREASVRLPRQVEIWESLSAIAVSEGREAEGLKILLDGRRRFRGRRHREGARRLLTRALELRPDHLGAGLDLARVLWAQGSRDEARALLERLADRPDRKERRRVRWTAFRLRPTPAAFWRWLLGR